LLVRDALCGPGRRAYSSTGSADGSLKLFAKPPFEALEVSLGPEYDHHRGFAKPGQMPTFGPMFLADKKGGR
jgi:hypothetical protein